MLRNDGPPPSYNETLRINYSNSVDFLNANDAYFFGDSKLELDSPENCVDEDEDEENEIILQQDEFVRRQLKENYPLLYVIIDSLVMAIISVILIALQILASQYNAALSYIGSAIWAGVYNILTVLVVLLTIKFRNATLVMVATTMKLFGMIISFGGFILVNAVAFYHYNCVAVSYYRPCYNSNMKPIHYMMIILGIPCVILSIVFFIFFQFKLLAKIKIGKSRNYDVAN